MSKTDNNRVEIICAGGVLESHQIPGAPASPNLMKLR
jgi:hypothetical protein